MNQSRSKSVAVTPSCNLSIEIKPIPLAHWVSDPNTWDKYQFIQEASDFIWNAYGHSTDQDKHSLAMLAEMLETFVICCKDISTDGWIPHAWNHRRIFGDKKISNSCCSI